MLIHRAAANVKLAHDHGGGGVDGMRLALARGGTGMFLHKVETAAESGCACPCARSTRTTLVLGGGDVSCPAAGRTSSSLWVTFSSNHPR
jgi:hypothetical protein